MIRYKQLPDPRCKVCNGKGEIRRIVNGERQIDPCRCIRLRDVSTNKPIPGIKNPRREK